MSAALFRLVLLVSCAHALVHVFELAWPSVEQEITAEYFPNDAAAGKRLAGIVSNTWRFAFGFGALAAGWLVDRWGARPMLAAYLIGCGATCAVVAGKVSLSALLPVMLVMGGFASIYHPAGLALISHATNPANRTRALGMHGIFGSFGIGAAPLLAWLLLGWGLPWRYYYGALAVLGVALGAVFVAQSLRRQPEEEDRPLAPSPNGDAPAAVHETVNWTSYFTLTALAVMQGFVYAALMSFLPRYLSGESYELSDSTAAASLPWSKFWAAIVLWIGCVGQYLAGRYARAERLESQLTWVVFLNAPPLLWMAFADGWQRVAAAAVFSLIHFMYQPIYNSLIAKYTPRRRRSLCYGFSLAMGFGMGGFGALFAGSFTDPRVIYASLAAIAATAGALGVVLWRQNRSDKAATALSE